ncbi:CD1845 family protein [Streptococcus dysgalactiae subsp. equisimilis]
MRWIIKIILFPISLALSILTAFLTFLLGIGTALLYLLMMFCIFGAIASFLQKEVTIRIEALILGFLLSPYGIPMVEAVVIAVVIAFLEGINRKIRSV